MRRVGGLVIGAIALALSVIVMALLIYTALVNPSVVERLAAATGAATTALVIVGGLTAWQNWRLVKAAGEQARASHEQAVASHQLALAANEQTEVSRELAEASRKQAAASDTQAAATLALVEEARADRELEFRPFLTLHVHKRGDHGGRQYIEVVVANVGRGPALLTALAYHELSGNPKEHLYGSSELFELGAGGSASHVLYLDDRVSGQRYRRLTDGLSDPALAGACEDMVGNRYRWSSAGGFRQPPDVRRRGEPRQLDWAAWV